MSQRSNHRGLIATLVAVFMVFVLPACWFGALERANRLGTLAPSTSNSNEEREEHQPAEITIRDAKGDRPLDEKPPADVRVVQVEPPAPRTYARRGHVPQQSVLSVRRLL